MDNTPGAHDSQQSWGHVHVRHLRTRCLSSWLVLLTMAHGIPRGPTAHLRVSRAGLCLAATVTSLELLTPTSTSSGLCSPEASRAVARRDCRQSSTKQAACTTTMVLSQSLDGVGCPNVRCFASAMRQRKTTSPQRPCGTQTGAACSCQVFRVLPLASRDRLQRGSPPTHR